MERDDWIEEAIAGIRLVLNSEGAAVWSEVEARLADVPHADIGTAIDPHHLSSGRKLLLEEGSMSSTVETTRGGARVETFNLTGAPAKRSAARKRLLMGRFLGWAMGSNRYPRGFIGPAAEASLENSLHQVAATAGYRLLPKTKGEVHRVFNTDVQGGPLDNVALLTNLGTDGLPIAPVTVLFEVKNLRSWIYPSSDDLYQLLEKAATLQVNFPGQRIAPVLVCRRAHYTSFVMAKRLGFYIMELRRQLLLPVPELTDEQVEPVRRELGFRDLLVSNEADARLIAHLTQFFPSVVERTTETWAKTAPALMGWYRRLRRSDLTPHDRAQLMEAFRSEVSRVLGEEFGGW